MSLFRILSAALVIATLAIVSAMAEAPTHGTNYVEGEVIVTFKPGLDLPAAQSALQKHSLSMAKHYARLSEHRGRHTAFVQAHERSTASLLAELAKNPAIETVEPNYIRRITGAKTPNDPLFQQLWGLQNSGQPVRELAGTSGDDIKFLAAWALARPATNEIVVAVVDTGVDYTHPDLAANMWVNRGETANNGVDDDGNGYVDDIHGYNFAQDNGDPSDSGEHGSHVSGTIAAVGNNKLGVIGVNYRAKIMALRVSNDGQTFDTSALVEAIQYATMMKERGVNVVAINASYSGPSFSSAEQAAIQAAGDAGIVFCAAASNDSSDNDSKFIYPASYRLPNMIVVAATDQNDALASFSNYGATTVDLAAPGVNILSTTPPGSTSYVHTASATYPADAMTYAGTTQGLTGAIYDCGLGYPTNFPSGVRGNLALISRGTLFFSEKVSNAMAAGAVGAIIFNNTNTPFSGTLQYASNWIPAVSISQADGLALKATLPTTGTLFSDKDPSVIYQYLAGTSMATPHVVGAVAFAAMNFPNETVAERIQRILRNVDPVPGLSGKVATGGRLNLLKTVDSDGNGLPDWWEQKYFASQGNIDPNADPDGDGMTNFQEYLADTDPTDAKSGVRFTSAQTATNGTYLTWLGGTQARQYLQRSSSPNSAASWVDVLTNEPPTLSSTTFLDSRATNGAAFYRLRVERP